MFDDKDLPEWFVKGILCQKLYTRNFFVKLEHSFLKLCHLVFFLLTWKMSTIIDFYDFKPSFHLELIYLATKN